MSHTKEAILYWESIAPRVALASIMVKTGKKCRAQEGLERIESRLRHRVLLGTVARGCAELGAITQPGRCRGGTD